MTDAEMAREWATHEIVGWAAKTWKTRQDLLRRLAAQSEALRELVEWGLRVHGEPADPGDEEAFCKEPCKDCEFEKALAIARKALKDG